MNYEIEISDIAGEDLDSIIEYLIYKLKAPNAAEDFLVLLEQKIESLRTAPKAFKVIEDEALSLDQIRIMQVKNYLVFFVIDEKNKTVSIIRVLYGRRDWMNILLIGSI